MAHAIYLIRFIQDLQKNKQVSGDKQQQLDEDFHNSSLELQSGLKEHYAQVSRILQVYKVVSEKIKASRQGITSIRSDIASCKSLLQCNRTELRQLWLEHVKSGHRRQLSDLIVHLQQAPTRLQDLLGRKEWVEATKLYCNLHAEMMQWDREIKAIKGLESSIRDITEKYKLLCEKLKEELRYLLFRKPVEEALQMFQNHDSMNPSKRGSIRSSTSSNNRQSDLASVMSTQCQSYRHYHHLQLADWEQVDLLSLDQLVAIFDASTSQDDSTGNSVHQQNRLSGHHWAHNILIVCQCLHRLQRLVPVLELMWQSRAALAPNAQPHFMSPLHASGVAMKKAGASKSRTAGVDHHVHVLRSNLHQFSVLWTMQQMIRSAYMSGETVPLWQNGQSRQLHLLLGILFNMLYMSGAAHCFLRRALQHILNTDKNDNKEGVEPTESLSEIFQECNVLRSIQEEVVLILSAHLDITLNEVGDVTPWKPSTKVIVETPTALSSDHQSLTAQELSYYFMPRKRIKMPFIGSVADASADLLANNDSNLPEDERTFASGSSNSGGGLFRFSNSCHDAITLGHAHSSLDRHEMANDTADPGPKSIASGTNAMGSVSSSHLVCKPSRQHVIAIYNDVTEFCIALETYGKIVPSFSVSTSTTMSTNGTGSSLRSASFRKSREQCHLRQFLKQFVEQVYLPELEHRLIQLTDAELKNCQNSVACGRYDGGKNVDSGTSPVPVLSIMFTVLDNLNHVREVTMALSDHRTECLRIGQHLLRHFIQEIWQMYHVIGHSRPQGDSIKERPPALSCDWAKDKDIIRFWKTFPSWKQVMSEEEQLMNSCRTAPFSPSSDASATYHDSLASITRINRRNRRMSMVPGTFGVEEAAVNNILSEKELRALPSLEKDQIRRMIFDEDESGRKDAKLSQLPRQFCVAQMKQMAHLHESLTWLYYQLLPFPRWIRTYLSTSVTNISPEDVQAIVQEYHECVMELRHLAHSCLLMLYLECRVSAYIYLANLKGEAQYNAYLDTIDIDAPVQEFIQQITKLTDGISSSLTRSKLRFLFVGLGHFISSLLVDALKEPIYMNTNGIKKMCRNIYHLQQALTTLSNNNESELIDVKGLYEMLHLTPEGVLNKIMEDGARFDESVYLAVFQMYRKNHPTHDYAKVMECVQRLKELVSTAHV